jgi:hypothetical protein
MPAAPPSRVTTSGSFLQSNASGPPNIELRPKIIISLHLQHMLLGRFVVERLASGESKIAADIELEQVIWITVDDDI